MSVYLPDNRITAPELWYPGRKPTVPVKLINNAITAQMRCYYLFREGVGLPKDLKTNEQADPIGAASPVWVEGKGYRTQVDGLRLNAIQPQLTVNDDYCWFIDFILNYSSQPYNVIYGNRFDSTNYMKITLDKVEVITNSNTISYPSFTVGKRHTACLIKKGDTYKFYRDGEFMGSTVLGATVTSNNVFIGGGRFIGGYQNVDLTVLSAFHGNISAAESLATSLHVKPYQFLEAA